MQTWYFYGHTLCRCLVYYIKMNRIAAIATVSLSLGRLNGSTIFQCSSIYISHKDCFTIIIRVQAKLTCFVFYLVFFFFFLHIEHTKDMPFFVLYTIRRIFHIFCEVQQSC